MSLFKTRVFWSTQSEDDEYFDQNSLILSKLNTESDYIISGSQSGVLRIFKPSCILSENDRINGYVATDLLIEKLFDYPILQIGTGRLVSGSQNVQLAILYPKLLSVLNFNVKKGITEHGTQHSLDEVYGHILQKSAASFTIGPFGGTQNRDFICVQSLDGMLIFFEQENVSFSCFLPDFLLPSPMAYIKMTDSFVTGNGNWHVHSYKYNSLSDAEQKSDHSVVSPGKVISEWSYNLGETILDISVIEDVNSKQSSIVILGERNLFCLNEKGKMKFMKKLDNTLLIYKNTTLNWSTKLNFSPVCIRRAFFEQVEGALVLLSEEGRLECCYLGTEPSPFVSPLLTTTELDFDKVEEELEKINSIMKNSYGNDIKLTNQNTKKEISMKIFVHPELVPCTFENNLKNVENQQMCAITIDVIPQILFEEVQVTVSVLPPLKVYPKTHFFSSISERSSFTCYAFLNDDCDVPSLNVDVAATIISNLGIPRCISEATFLPLRLVSEIGEPQKDAEHKITLLINQASLPIARLFPEFVEDTSLSQNASAFAFQPKANSGSTVTILQAKSTERYRLQSNSLAALSVIIEQMIFRLKRHYSNTNGFKVFYNSALPSNELVLYVDGHFKKRQRVIELEEYLCQLSSQYRIIQKRLIAKFKMKNPSPLTNLEILLEDTHSDIIEVTEKLKSANFELCRARTNLSCGLNLLFNMMKVMDVDRKLKESLESVFCPSVQDLESQNWEDVMDSSLCYLLRTSLAKSDKDTTRMAQTNFEEVKDISKLMKHINQVIERVTKLGNVENSEDISEGNNEETETKYQEEQKIEKLG
nr:protein PTHB1 [Leptinotarsa decemlineata]